MDKELSEAMELSRDDLLAKLKTGQPADLARVRPAREAVVTVHNASSHDLLQLMNTAPPSAGVNVARRVRGAEVQTAVVG